MAANSFMEWRLGAQQYRTAADADQAEIAALCYHATNIDEGIRDEALAGELADEEEREERASLLIDEVNRRSTLLTDAYPFKRQRNALEYSPSATAVYEFCLSISAVSSLSDASGKRYQIAFERLVRDVLRCFLGSGAKAYRTGMPGDELEQRPKMIDGMIKEIAGLLDNCGEWIWRPDEEHPMDPRRSDAGDLGIDVVAWKAMPDRRRGNLFLVAQCACGDNWEAKSSDIHEKRLERWISPLMFAPFVKVFAIPFHVPNIPRFGELNGKYGLMLDRARIALLAEAPGNRELVVQSAPEKYADLARAAISAAQVVQSRPKRRRRKARGGRRSQ